MGCATRCQLEGFCDWFTYSPDVFHTCLGYKKDSYYPPCSDLTPSTNECLSFCADVVRIRCCFFSGTYPSPPRAIAEQIVNELCDFGARGCAFM